MGRRGVSHPWESIRIVKLHSSDLTGIQKKLMPARRLINNGRTRAVKHDTSRMQAAGEHGSATDGEDAEPPDTGLPTTSGPVLPRRQRVRARMLSKAGRRVRTVDGAGEAVPDHGAREAGIGVRPTRASARV